jgi:hypothetical protein
MDEVLQRCAIGAPAENTAPDLRHATCDRRVESQAVSPKNVIQVGDGFWNLRGSLRIGGVVDIGTQASLVRRESGTYVFLDACRLDEETRRWVDEQTKRGEAIEAVLHLHPFHTLFVRRLHELYPRARLYGTARHQRMHPDLPWMRERTDEPSLHKLFEGDLEFSVPRGVDLIPSNERLHFSSVLAFHPRSRTLHVDDTLNYLRLPKLIRPLKEDVLTFHPALPGVLERRRGAIRDFRDWIEELLERSRPIENLCAAHVSVLLGRDNTGPSIRAKIESAARRVERKLVAHQNRYG